MNVWIQGVYHAPVTETVSKSITITDKLIRLLPELRPNTPVLFCAGTGAGKTSAILHGLIPFAKERGVQVCFVSSRAAINTQFKRALAKALGEEQLLTDFTEAGLRHVEQIGHVQILTYHALWGKLCRGDLKWTTEYLVFDEVHALTLDALFVPFTGSLLEKLTTVFAGARRIYLSATPEPVLKPLLKAEGSRQLRIFRWPPNFDHIIVHFYQCDTDLIQHFLTLPQSEKVLIFTRSIHAGEALLKKLGLGTGALITSRAKEDDPEEWARLLSEQTLKEQITVATNVMDAGVSLSDPALRHIVCSGLDIAEVLQQAGRRRLRSGEKLKIYLWSPSRKALGQKLMHASRLLQAVRLCKEDRREFVRRFIIGDENPDIRSMCYLGANDTIHINGLAEENLQRQVELCETLLKKKGEFPADGYFCKALKQKIPDDECRWLDHRHSRNSKKELLEWLKTRPPMIEKSDQEGFGSEFKRRYQKAFGPRKNDRGDRGWGLSVCKQVLTGLNWGIGIESKGGVWRLVNTCRELEK